MHLGERRDKVPTFSSFVMFRSDKERERIEWRASDSYCNLLQVQELLRFQCRSISLRPALRVSFSLIQLSGVIEGFFSLDGLKKHTGEL